MDWEHLRDVTLVFDEDILRGVMPPVADGVTPYNINRAVVGRVASQSLNIQALALSAESALCSMQIKSVHPALRARPGPRAAELARPSVRPV